MIFNYPNLVNIKKMNCEKMESMNGLVPRSDRVCKELVLSSDSIGKGLVPRSERVGKGLK